MVQLDNKEIGRRINSIRIEKGDNLREFGERIARKMNIPKDQAPADSLVSRWEKGKNRPNNERLKAIADIGNKTVEYLLYGGVDVKKIYDECLLSLKKLDGAKNSMSINPEVDPLITDEVNGLILNDKLIEASELLSEIEEDFLPLLRSRIEKYGATNLRKEFYARDRILAIAQAFTDKLGLNNFDEIFNKENEFPTIKEDLIYFSENIPYLKGKEYVYVNTDENYQLLVKDQVEQSLEARYFIRSEKELKSLEDTKSTFSDIIKTYEEIEQLQYSDSVNQVYNANLDYQNGKSDIRIYDGASYIDYLDFANRYFSELLDDSDIINEIGSRKQFSSDLNSQIAVEMFKSGIEKNILDNNKLIEQIQNNLNK
ncbi:helix-turn-helix domain-containing protein [Aerococcus urinaeequi]|uniref:helix-turn-helix domain-containing protein n=1 Tax=Aerococcus urinaeequi TaxID=51665 RepID=UPI003D6B05B9